MLTEEEEEEVVVVVVVVCTTVYVGAIARKVDVTSPRITDMELGVGVEGVRVGGSNGQTGALLLTAASIVETKSATEAGT
jgi:hypothetical protein